MVCRRQFDRVIALDLTESQSEFTLLTYLQHPRRRVVTHPCRADSGVQSIIETDRAVGQQRAAAKPCSWRPLTVVHKFCGTLGSSPRYVSSIRHLHTRASVAFCNRQRTLRPASSALSSLADATNASHPHNPGRSRSYNPVITTLPRWRAQQRGKASDDRSSKLADRTRSWRSEHHARGKTLHNQTASLPTTSIN